MKKNLFLITEEERERILGMHKRATASQYLSEAGPFEDTDPLAATTPPAAGTTPPAAGTTPPAAGTTPPAAGTTPPAAGTTPQSQTLVMNDRDYVYKKEGDKYFFKLQPNPGSAKAQEYKKSGKFLNWTEAKGTGLEAIKKLDFKPETLTLKDAGLTNPLKQTTTTAQTAPPVKPLATGGGSQPTGQAVTAQTNPQVSADLKSASQIRQEFRQGKRDMRKIQRERDKLYNTYNRLSGKMDKATDKSYLDSIAQLDQLLSQK